MTAGKRVLVLDDQMMLAFALREVLTSVGLECIGPFAKVNDALASLQDGKCDFALLDINLGNEGTSEPVAEALMALNIPFAFVTGYGSAVPLDEKFDAVGRYQKPISRKEILSAVGVA